MAQKHGPHSACLVDSVVCLQGVKVDPTVCTRPVTGHTTTRLITRPLIVRTLSLLVSFSLSRNVAVVFVGFSILSVCASDTRSPLSTKRHFPLPCVPQRFPVCLWRVGVHVAGAPKPSFDSCLVSNRLPLRPLWSHSLEPSRFPLSTVGRPLKQTIAFLPYQPEDCYLCVCSVPYGPSLWSDYLIMVQFYATQAIAPFFLLFSFNDTQSIDFGPLQIC